MQGYIAGLNSVKPHLRYYTSIDTYAKYLKLTGNERDYHKLKNVLTMFFMLEQFVNLYLNPDNEQDLGIIVNYPGFGGIDFRSPINKKFNLDPRYNNFVVSLMNEAKWPSNVKVLSWNYDFQLEMTCNSIFPGLLNYYPSGKKHPNTHLFHLNGIAGVSKDRELVLGSDKAKLSSFSDVISRWSDLVSGRGYNPFLKFAWESDLNWELVEDHLRQTEILVVIGYSFPFFNREVDSKIFNYLFKRGKLSKIYFQNKELDGQFLFEQFNLRKKSDVKYQLFADDNNPDSDKFVEIEQYPHLDRFFIPNEYYPEYH